MTLAIYLIGVADNLQAWAKGFVIGSLILGIICVVCAPMAWALLIEEPETLSVVKRVIAGIWRKLLVAWCAALAFALFTPDSKTLAAMYVVPKLAESDVAQKTHEGLKLLVDEWVSELRPKREKE